MIALLQRVSEAEVSVDARPVARIGAGLVAFVGVQQGDSDREALRLAERTARLRAFPDAEGRMARSVLEAGGEVLAVSEITLCADLSSGHRPSFAGAAPPEEARRLLDLFAATLRKHGLSVGEGEFRAHMRVRLANDGPVTFLLKESGSVENA